MWISRCLDFVKMHTLAVYEQKPVRELRGRSCQQFERFPRLHSAYHSNRRAEHTQRAAGGFLELLAWREDAGVARRTRTAGGVINAELSVQANC